MVLGVRATTPATTDSSFMFLFSLRMKKSINHRAITIHEVLEVTTYSVRCFGVSWGLYRF